MLTELEFKSLASQGYNRIPLMQEAFADLETPLSLYLKLAHSQNAGRYSFLLESVVGGERFGRYSFIGLPARGHLVSHGFGESAVTQVVRDGVVEFAGPRTELPPATLVTTPCAMWRKNSRKLVHPTPWVAPTSFCSSARSWR